MSDNTAFKPSGQTAALAATNTSTATPIQVLSDSGEVQNQTFLIVNTGATPAFLAWGGSPNVTAVVPTAGTPAYGVPIPGNSAQTFNFSPKSYFAVITATGTTTIYITPGNGI